MIEVCIFKNNNDISRFNTVEKFSECINYTVIHNYGNPWFLLNNSTKNWPILIIFGTQHYEKS